MLIIQWIIVEAAIRFKSLADARRASRRTLDPTLTCEAHPEYRQDHLEEPQHYWALRG